MSEVQNELKEEDLLVMDEERSDEANNLVNKKSIPPTKVALKAGEVVVNKDLESAVKRKGRPPNSTKMAGLLKNAIQGVTSDGRSLYTSHGRERRVYNEISKTLPDGSPIYKGKRGRKKGIKGLYDYEESQEYPLEAKVDAVTCWTVTANLRTVSEILNIRFETLSKWKQQPWWYDLAAQIKQEKQEQLDAGMSAVIDKSMQLLNDRLENGDVVVNAKTGAIIRSPMSVQATVNTLKNVFDKRQLIRNEPTSISRSESTDERLKRLSEEFAKFSSATQINQSS